MYMVPERAVRDAGVERDMVSSSPRTTYRVPLCRWPLQDEESILALALAQMTGSLPSFQVGKRGWRPTPSPCCTVSLSLSCCRCPCLPTVYLLGLPVAAQLPSFGQRHQLAGILVCEPGQLNTNHSLETRNQKPETRNSDAEIQNASSAFPYSVQYYRDRVGRIGHRVSA